MEIRKFQHACLELTQESVSLIIDPGNWSRNFEVNDHTLGVVITHEHADHFDSTKLLEILKHNPKLCIYAHVDIIAQLDTFPGRKQSVAAGEAVSIGPFSLHFTGGTHATIHSSYPVPPNLGIIVNNGDLYYPGDSFALPDCRIETLAVPASAPWLKVSEAMDFITTVQPKTCFPTHDALLSDEGRQLTNTWLGTAAATVNATYTVL